MDTGATSSLASSAFLKRLGIEVRATLQGAKGVNKIPVGVKGEASFVLRFGSFKLPITIIGYSRSPSQCLLDTDLLSISQPFEIYY